MDDSAERENETSLFYSFFLSPNVEVSRGVIIFSNCPPVFTGTSNGGLCSRYIRIKRSPNLLFSKTYSKLKARVFARNISVIVKLYDVPKLVRKERKNKAIGREGNLAREKEVVMMGT